MSAVNDSFSIEARTAAGPSLTLPGRPGPGLGTDSVRSRVRGLKERLIEGSMFLSAFLSVLVTVGIVALLLYESIEFFRAEELDRLVQQQRDRKSTRLNSSH